MILNRTSINQKLITLLLVLGMASNYRLTLENTVWSQLTEDAEFNRMIFDLCLNFISLFIFTGSIVVNFFNIKAIIKVNLLILFISVASLLFEDFRSIKIIYMIMGGSLGTFYITYIYLMIHGLDPTTRSRRIGLILLCVYLYKYFTDYLIALGGLQIVLTLQLLIYSGIFVTVNKLKFEADRTSYLNKYYKTSYSFLLVLGTLIFISYFQVFLVGTDHKLLAIINQPGWNWLNQLVHLVICFGFFVHKGSLNYPQIIYFSLLSLVLAFMLGALPVKAAALICIFYNISDALGDIFLFNLLGDFITKHRQKPLFLSLIALFMTLGVSGASYFVNGISSRVNDNVILIYSCILIVFGFSLLLIPFLNRKIEEDLYEIYSLKARKNEFVSLFNHSLKNLATQMSYGIEVLKAHQHQANRAVAETLELMSDSVNRMLKTVKSIDSQSGKMLITRETCEMRDLITAVLEAVKITSVNKKITVTTVFDEDTGLVCDKEKVIEALYNIIKNSYEAIGKENEGQIRIEVYKNNHQLICKVTDNGCGISNQDINKVLKPFYSTKKVSNDNFGLGLTYCNAVMKEHDGLIDIESQENVGTMVSLIFPVR